MNHTLTTAYLHRRCYMVRHSNRTLLSDGRSKCCICQKYRSTLERCSLKRNDHSETNTFNSHANYHYLQSDELKDRLKNVQRSIRITKRQNDCLREKLKNFLLKQTRMSIRIIAVNIFKEFLGNNNATIKQEKNEMPPPHMIHFAVYRSVGNSLALPSQRTLQDYTHVLKFDAGVSGGIVKRLKEDMRFDQCSSSQKKVTVPMDKMKIKSSLVFNTCKSTGKLHGFVYLGDVNRDLEKNEVNAKQRKS